MATRTNVARMARRSGAASSLGGHRGKSGQNGAGNHRYTEAEKKMVEAARAETQVILDAQKLEKKRAAKHVKNIATLRQRMLDQKVATLGRNVARLAWEDMGTFVSFKCHKGHTFDRIPRDVVTSRSKYICQDCARDSMGKPRADARIKYAMRLDEQGMEVAQLKSLSEKCIIRDRDTGETFKVFPGNVDRWKRSKDDRQIRFVADDADHVFVFRGNVPEVKHPFVAYLLKRFPIETAEDVRGKPITGIDSMRKVIEQFVEDGDKVVNMSLNDAWVGGFEYSWGKIPQDAALAKYMDDMKAAWS